MALSTRITHNGETFNCSARQAAALDILMDTNGGGFAMIHGYKSNSTGEVADISFISRFSMEKLYARKREALESMKVEDIMDLIRENPKIKALDTDGLYTAFDDRKAFLIESIDKTDSGDRSDAHRQAHDRNYIHLVPGVKVNLVSEKVDGKQIPVLDADGFPTVASIMLNIIQVSKTVKVEGTHKVVNSGVPVILSNAMDKKLPKSCKIKSLSLKEDNFESLSIAGEELLPSLFKGI